MKIFKCTKCGVWFTPKENGQVLCPICKSDKVIELSPQKIEPDCFDIDEDALHS